MKYLIQVIEPVNDYHQQFSVERVPVAGDVLIYLKSYRVVEVRLNLYPPEVDRSEDDLSATVIVQSI